LFGGIDCFQYHVKVYTTEHVGGKTFGFDIVFQNSSRKEYIKTKNYEERKWNHVCWRADSNGENHFFINGEVRKTFYNPLVVIPSNQKKKSAFLVGQEPDTLRGSFNHLQAFRGRISGLNIYNYTLTDEEIRSMANCSKLISGNVIKWGKNDWIFNNTSPNMIDSSDFCLKTKHVILFPVPVYLTEAFNFCIVHNGSLYVPENEIENEKLLKLVKPTLNKCDPQSMKVG
jgi:hypothetical protein